MRSALSFKWSVSQQVPSIKTPAEILNTQMCWNIFHRGAQSLESVHWMLRCPPFSASSESIQDFLWHLSLSEYTQLYLNPLPTSDPLACAQKWVKKAGIGSQRWKMLLLQCDKKEKIKNFAESNDILKGWQHTVTVPLWKYFYIAGFQQTGMKNLVSRK